MAKTQIFKDYKSFLKREDKSINGVNRYFAKRYGIDLDLDNGNKGCWNCVDCWDCWDCVRCVDCGGCGGLNGENHG